MINGNTSLLPNAASANRSPLYDSRAIATTTPVGTSYDFFGQITGGAIGRETTNMQQAFRLPDPNSFLLYGMRIVVIGNQADLESLYQRYVFQLIIGETTFIEGPPEFFPAGGGTSGSTNVTSGFLVTNGVPASNSTFMIPDDCLVQINPGDTFRVRMQSSVGFSTTAALFIRVILDGKHWRGIRG
jgi:hypothetical protein